MLDDNDVSQLRIAVTSGHTQSVVLTHVVLGGRSKINVTSGPSLNLHSLAGKNIDKRMAKRLDRCLNSAFKHLPKSLKERGLLPIDRLVVALPGVSTIRDLEAGEMTIKGSKWPQSSIANFRVIDDTFAGLLAGAQSTQGICAFAGTGASVFVGTPNGEHRHFVVGKPYKLDGFGPLLGDHGSGFRLAVAALESLCRWIDTAVPIPDDLNDTSKRSYPLLLEKFLEKLQSSGKYVGSHGCFLQNWFDDQLSNRTPNWRFEVASLAEIVTSLAQEGDNFSRKLVEESAAALAKTVRLALDSPDFADMHNAQIFCQGGMFRHSPFYFEKFQETLSRQGKSNDVQLSRFQPCVGALLMACSDDWTFPRSDKLQVLLNDLEAVVAANKRLIFNRV